MDFSEMKCLFLEQNKYKAYKSELENFEAYLITKNHGDISQVYLQGIRTEDIIDSLQKIIENGQYSSKSIALKYMTVIAQFFRYATIQNWFQNSNFLLEVNASDEDDKHSYYKRVSTYIEKNRMLEPPLRKEPIGQEEASRILEYINSYISEENYNNISLDKCAALLAIKLTLFTGVKYKVLCSLNTTDVDLETNQLMINGFLVRMPIQFTKQMQIYLRLRSNYTCNSLFIQADGRQWTITATSKITDVLKLILCRTDTTGITKYGIQQLLLVGTSIPIIEELTGARKDVIRRCSTETLSIAEQRSLYLNRHISQTDIYYRC